MGRECFNAADVLLELLSSGRDRKNYVNMIIRVCALYCDILFLQDLC